MEPKHIEKTNSIVRFPRKWHNNKVGFITLLNLYNLGKKSQTLILSFDKTSYISFNVFIFLKLCVDRLAAFFNTEVLFFTGTKISNNIDVLLSLTQDKDEIIKYSFFNNYYQNDENSFKTDLENSLNFIDYEEIKSCLRLNLSELFINACKHCGDISDLGEFGIYFGFNISNKKIRLVIANNGDFFSKQIINKHKITYSNEYEYIQKALELGFSTKKEYDGGLGLHLIEQLSQNCSGKLLILSGKGLFCNVFSNNTANGSKYTYKEDSSSDLSSPLPGTIVYMEFNISDLTIENINKNYETELFDQIFLKEVD